MTSNLPTRLTAANTVAVGRPVRVYYNGYELYNVVACDTEQGWVEMYLSDGMGNVRIDPNSPIGNPTLLSQILFGDVTVEPA